MLISVYIPVNLSTNKKPNTKTHTTGNDKNEMPAAQIQHIFATETDCNIIEI